MTLHQVVSSLSVPATERATRASVPVGGTKERWTRRATGKSMGVISH